VQNSDVKATLVLLNTGPWHAS